MAPLGIGHGQDGQVAVFDERRDPDDRVVPPVGTRGHLRHAAALRKERAVDVAGKLQYPPQERAAQHHVGLRLQDAHLRVRLHRAHHPHHGRAAHDAVGVEHDHVPVTLAPATAEIGHVAALAVDGVAALAVEDLAERIKPAAERQPRAFLLHPVVGVVGIAAEIEVEMLDLARLLEAAPHVGDPGADPRHIFIIDRHDNGGGGQGNVFLVGSPRTTHDVVGIAAAQPVEKTHQREDEADGDLAEEEREKRHDHVVGPENLLARVAAQEDSQTRGGEKKGEADENRSSWHRVGIRGGGVHRYSERHQ